MEDLNNGLNSNQAECWPSGGGDQKQVMSPPSFLPVHPDSSGQFSDHTENGCSLLSAADHDQQPSCYALHHQPVASLTAGQHHQSSVFYYQPVSPPDPNQFSACYSNGGVAQQLPGTFLIGQNRSHFDSYSAGGFYGQIPFPPTAVSLNLGDQITQMASYQVPGETVVFQPQMSFSLSQNDVPVPYTNSLDTASVQDIAPHHHNQFGTEKQTTYRQSLQPTDHERQTTGNKLSQPFHQQLETWNENGHTSASTWQSRRNSGQSDSLPFQQQPNLRCRRRRKMLQTKSSSSRLSNRNLSTAQTPQVSSENVVQLKPWRPPDYRYAEQFQSSFYKQSLQPCIHTSFRGLSGDTWPMLNESPVRLSLDTLPSLVILQILSYLSIQDLVLRVRATCWHLHEVSHDPSLWTHVNVSQIETYKKRRVVITELLEQNCYIAGRQDPQITEDDNRLDAMNPPQIQDSESMSSLSTATCNTIGANGNSVCPTKSQRTEHEYVDVVDNNSNTMYRNKLCTKQQNRRGKLDTDLSKQQNRRGKLDTDLSKYTEERQVCKTDPNQNDCENVGSEFYAFSQRHNKYPNTVFPHSMCTGEEQQLDEVCQQVIQKKKHVKDYIRELNVNNEPRIAAVSFVCSTEKENEIWTNLNHSLTLPSETVCARLNKLSVSCVKFEPTILTMVNNHPWLTELSVTVLNRQSRFSLKVIEGDLTACYETFRTLKHLKKFQFVFPTSSSISTKLVGNMLYFNTDRLYAAERNFFETVTDVEDIVATDVTDKVIRTIVNNCSKLKRLAFSSHSFSKNGFVSRQPVLTLQSLAINSSLSSLNSEIGSQIAEVFPNLRTVNLTGVHVTDEGLETLLKKCRKLEAIHLYSEPREDLPKTDRAYKYTLPTLSHLCAANRTPLKEYSVRANLGDDFIHKLCTHNTTLTSVALMDCPDLTDIALVTVTELCPHLKHFGLTQENSHVTAQGVLYLVQNCPSLASVEVYSLSDKGRFVSSVKNDRLTDVDWQGPKNTQQHFHNRLDRYSKPSSTSAADFRSRQTRNFTTNTSQRSRRTSNRSVHAREGMDDKTFDLTVAVNGEYLPHAENAPAPVQSKMREFSLGRVPQMTYWDLLALVRVCPDLVELHLSGCLALTDSTVAVIMRGCPRLQSLTLNRQARGVTFKTCHLTDASLHLLARHGRALQQFRAFNCYKFSPLGLARLLVHSKSLETLSVTLDKFHVLKNFADVNCEVRRQAAACSPPMCLKLGFREDFSFQQGRAYGRMVKVIVLKRTVSKKQPPLRGTAETRKVITCRMDRRF